MDIQDDIIINDVSKFLTLYDIAILASISKRFSNIRDELFLQVSTIYPIRCKRNYERFLQHLTEKCRNVTNLTTKDHLLSNTVLEYIHKFPLKKLTVINHHVTSNIIDFNVPFIIRGQRCFKIPTLVELNVYKLSDYDISECKNLEILTVELCDSYPEMEKLHTINIDELVKIDEADDEFFNLPIKQIYLRSATRNISKLRRFKLKCLHITDKGNIKHEDVMAEIKRHDLEELHITSTHDLSSFLENMKLKTLGLMCQSTTPVIKNTLEMYPLKLPLLTKLKLSAVTLDDFSYFDGLPNLTTLALYECVINDNITTPLPPKLNTLVIDGTVFPMKYITDSNIYSMQIINSTVNDIEYLPRKLIRLDIVGTKINNYDNFPYLPNLSVLNLSSSLFEYDSKTTLSDVALDRITSCPLSSLTLISKSINDDNIHYIARLQLSHLNISEASITINGLAKLKHLPLRYLEIPDMSIAQIFKC